MDPHRTLFSPAVAAWAEAIVEELSREYQFGNSAVLLYDRDADALRLVGQRFTSGDNSSAVDVGAMLVPLESVTGVVFRSGQPALLADARSHPEYRSLPGSIPGSELAVPIIVDGRPMGVINVESPRVGGLDIVDLGRLQATARRAADKIPDDVPRGPI